MTLQGFKGSIVRVALRIGSKILSRPITTFRFLRGLESYGYLMLRNGFFDFSEGDVKSSFDLNRAWLERGSHKIDSILFFVSPFGKEPSAGPRNILGLAKFFQGKGIQLYFAVVGVTRDDAEMVEGALRHNDIDAKVFLVSRPQDVDSLPFTTIAIATYWVTAYPLLRFHNTNAKVYLIQDEETAFYPAGVLQYFAEYTYRFGFIGLTNAHEIKEWYENTYGMPCFYFPPFIIRASRRREQNNIRIRRILTYFRPGVPRNAPELLYLVLKNLRRSMMLRLSLWVAKLFVIRNSSALGG